MNLEGIEPVRFLKISEKCLPAQGSYGAKALRLIELAQEGYPVPDGILLSVEYLNELMDTVGIFPELKKIHELEAKGIVGGLEESVLSILGEVKPPVAFDSLLQTVKTIEGYTPSIRFAVRSAALGEDDNQSSFAGLYHSLLHVTMEGVWEAVLKCYASFWSFRAVQYRQTKSILPEKPSISIIVQRLLKPEYSGVLFTMNPLNGEAQMVVEAVEGIGESLVSGQVTPRRWTIEISSHSIKEDPTSPLGPKVPESILKDLTRYALLLKDKYRSELDMEWAVENKSLYLLQVRPITTQAAARNKIEGFYSRAVVEDLWQEPMTPITASLIFEKLSEVYTFKKTLLHLSLKEIAEIPALRVEKGYGFLHLFPVLKLMKYLPKSFRFRQVLKMFPKEFQEMAAAVPFSRLGFLKILFRLPRVPLSEPASFPLLTIPLLRRGIASIYEALSGLLPVEGAEYSAYKKELLYLTGLVKDLQTKNQWGYGYAAVFMWILDQIGNRFKLPASAILESVREIPRNVSSEIQSEMALLASECPEEIKDFLLSLSGEDVWEKFRKRFQGNSYLLKMEHFVKKWGWRSPRRDLICNRWEEDPGLVLELLKGALSSGILRPGDKKIQPPLEGALIPLLPRLLLSLVAMPAKKFLALREDLRFALDGLLYRIRLLLLRIQFKFKEMPEDWIFYVTLDELVEILDGSLKPLSLGSEIVIRKESYQKSKAIPPPYFILPEGHDCTSVEEKSSQPCKTFSGVGASSGIVEGKVRMIRHPGEFGRLLKGEILVTVSTDPGWTPLFLTAKAVVTEIGGILNHCSIIAREYGIPAVVGIKDACILFRDGMRLRVDGSRGEVTLLDESEDQTGMNPERDSFS